MSARQLLIETGLHKTLWGKRIIKAEEVNGFTSKNKTSANTWITCACGKISPKVKLMIADEPKNGPLDHIIRSLGYKFNVDVSSDKFVRAAKTLIKIEARAIWLLDEEHNE